MADFHLESETMLPHPIFGLDEAGRGSWCGPVVAACVCWPQLRIPPSLAQNIRDSKKLTPLRRDRLFDEIMSSSAIIGIGEATAQEIDTINILQASFLAMERALNVVKENGYSIGSALIDGNRLPQNWAFPTKAVVHGDDLSLSIAAASILAKVTRDRKMRELSQQYPAYGWDQNAGYGTKQHKEALQKYGITPFHRKTYAPVKAFLTPSPNRQQSFDFLKESFDKV